MRSEFEFELGLEVEAAPPRRATEPTTELMGRVVREGVLDQASSAFSLVST